MLAPHLVDQLNLGGGKVDIARDQVQSLDARAHQHVVHRHPGLHQQVVHSGFQLVVGDPQTGR
ncbi:Uncharacterised protein [Mycobacteroides abscessus subsp. abscessus]|nr:Uncharacterised protein [Mycobacteroides abscessus subsp. abscessus]